MRIVPVIHPMKLELFHKMPCPYSAKVRDYIDEKDIKSQITYRDILKDQSAHDELVRMNVGETVPCLVIDGKPMLESDDIVAWLESNVVGDSQAK